MQSTSIIIDQSVLGRVGWPSLPVFPVETISAFGYESDDLTEIEHDVKDILDKHTIHSYELSLAWRWGSMDADAEHQLTLIIISQYRRAYQQLWVNAVIDVRMFLQQCKIDWCIELIDEAMWFGKADTLPILSTERDLIEGWKKARPEFLTKIKDHDWVAVDVLHRGYSKNRSKDKMYPTVTISARDAKDRAWWDKTLPVLRQVLQEHGVHAEVELLLTKGLDFATTENTAKEEYTFPYKSWDHLFDNPIRMGTSCAASGSECSATLGGWIRLKESEAIIELGLTNNHVSEDGIISRDSLSGPLRPTQDSQYGKIVSPSDSDCEFRMRREKEAIQLIEHKLERIRSKLARNPQNHPRWDEFLWAKSGQEKHLEESTGKVSDMAAYPREVGSIYSASGFSTRRQSSRSTMQPEGAEQLTSWAFDWCLFSIIPPHSSSWEPDFLSRVTSKYYIVASEDLGYLTNQDPNQAVEQYCALSADKSYKVAKRGRTSGWTCGTLSAIPSIICLPSRDKSGGKPVFAHAIIGKPLSPYTDTLAEPFLRAGDYGAFVMLNEPHTADGVNGLIIVGMGFAGNEGTVASYMMPFDALVEDIEAVTGGKVIEPHFAGNLY